MSGGVDSSLTAVLLKQQGYDVIGITMNLWDYESYGGNIHSDTACCSVESMNDARAVCESWKIPHYVLDLREEFEREVVEDFISEYLSGRTPNPCIICNQKMKWDVLFKKAKQLGASYLATGHYARIETDSQKKRCILKRGLDDSKDQSYFLWILTQEQLKQTLFPVGSMTKEETRNLAKDLSLKVAEKGDSQEICFIPDNDYRRFLKKTIEEQSPGYKWKPKNHGTTKLESGPIKNQSGKVVGSHDGCQYYTIGQRKGLGIAAGKPLYVTRIDAQENTVYVGSDEDLYEDTLIATQLNWISIPCLTKSLRCTSKIRYRHQAAVSIVAPLTDNTVTVRFQKSQRAITPGQSVVFYDGNVVIGGGIIDEVAKTM